MVIVCVNKFFVYLKPRKKDMMEVGKLNKIKMEHFAADKNVMVRIVSE